MVIIMRFLASILVWLVVAVAAIGSAGEHTAAHLTMLIMIALFVLRRPS